MIKCEPYQRVPITSDTIGTGMVVHTRASSAKCDPWLVIGQEGVSPLFGELGWRLMEMGEKAFKDVLTGKPLGKDGFTGRTSVLRPTHLGNFHTVLTEAPDG